MPSYKKLFEDNYSLYVFLDDKGDSDILTFLESKTDEAKTMLRRLRSLAKDPKGFPSEICHRVDDKDKIWQIRSEFHRILWFYDKGRIIVCSNIFQKKSNGSTPNREKDRAKRIKKDYFNQMRGGSKQ